MTITIRDHALVSAAGWSTAFAAGRYLEFTFPSYVPVGSEVLSATFRHSYRSLDGTGTTCYFVEVYEGAVMIAGHGSAITPVSCNGTASYVSDAIELPEINTVSRANSLSIRVYYRNSSGAQTQTYRAMLGVDYYLP